MKNILDGVIIGIIIIIVSVISDDLSLSANSYNSIIRDEYQGYTYDEISKSNVKPRIYITVDGNEKGSVFTTADSGKTVKVALCVDGADLQYASTGFHIYYDEKLNITMNNNTKKLNVNAGDAISELSACLPEVDPTAPAGFKGLYVSTLGEGNFGKDGEIWTIEFQLPSKLSLGDVFPIDIKYKKNRNAEDKFLNAECDEVGRLMSTYAFVIGINSENHPDFYAKADDIKKCNALSSISREFDGYIAIGAPPQTTTTTTINYTQTTTQVVQGLGDPNRDSRVDSSDASFILAEYARLSTGENYTMNEEQITDSDVNNDGKIDSKDASAILAYYAYSSTGGTGTVYQYMEMLNRPKSFHSPYRFYLYAITSNSAYLDDSIGVNVYKDGQYTLSLQSQNGNDKLSILELFTDIDRKEYGYINSNRDLTLDITIDKITIDGFEVEYQSEGLRSESSGNVYSLIYNRTGANTYEGINKDIILKKDITITFTVSGLRYNPDMTPIYDPTQYITKYESGQYTLYIPSPPLESKYYGADDSFNTIKINTLDYSKTGYALEIKMNVELAESSAGKERDTIAVGYQIVDISGKIIKQGKSDSVKAELGSKNLLTITLRDLDIKGDYFLNIINC